MARNPTKVPGTRTARAPPASMLYTLEVTLTGGPITEAFLRRNPVVSRTLQIRGNQTLQDLHWAIYKAFDRDEDHLFEFQIGGKGASGRGARLYQAKGWVQDLMGESPSADASRTKIGSLGLKTRQAFRYWFDFGDDWMHRVKVVSIEDKAPPGKFPRETARVGKSPPQYPDFD